MPQPAKEDPLPLQVTKRDLTAYVEDRLNRAVSSPVWNEEVANKLAQEIADELLPAVLTHIRQGKPT